MNRRELIALLGGAATSQILWPRRARTPRGKPPTFGFLGATTASA
jgi:hypothetical protein